MKDSPLDGRGGQTLPLPRRTDATRPRAQFVVPGSGVIYVHLAMRPGETWTAYSARVIAASRKRAGDEVPQFVQWDEL